MLPLALVRSGFCAGLMFLATVAILARLTRDDGSTVAILHTGPDVDDQVFQVLADARRILEDG